MTVQQCQQYMTSDEFVGWIRYLDLEYNEPTRTDYYLALIATETRRSYVTNPGRVKLEQMLLKFKGPGETPKDYAAHQAEQKAAFLAWASINAGTTRKPPEK